jgi:hypothetical protein
MAQRSGRKTVSGILAILPLALLLGGCLSAGGGTPQPVIDPAAVNSDPVPAGDDTAVTPVAFGPVSAFPTEKLVGSWGTASYREDKDISRVEAQARDQCKLPYKITKGPTDGVMMYFADSAELYELKVKSGGGKVFVGFEGPPGGWQDREVLSYSENRIIMKFVDPEINGRYGTFIFVRCS